MRRRDDTAAKSVEKRTRRWRRRARLRRVNARLREKAARYRTLLTLSMATAAVLALVLAGFVVFDGGEEAVLLGTGRAGLMTPDSTLAAAAYPDSLTRSALAHPPLLRSPGDASAAGTTAVVGGQALRGGQASYYGDELSGRRTASGERFDPERLTAAHRTLPLGSRVRVTNTRNGRSVVVRINDRGPFAERRVIDLSEGAARRIGMLAAGTARVRLELLSS